MSSTVKYPSQLPTSTRAMAKAHATQSAISRGTPAGMPLQQSYGGMPNTVPTGADGWPAFGGSVSSAKGEAGALVDPSFSPPYRWLPSVTPLSPNTAFSQMLGGQVGKGLANYAAGKHEQARFAMSPGAGAAMAKDFAMDESLPLSNRVAGAAAGGLQAGGQLAMWSPLVQSIWKSVKARSPLPLLGAAAKTYGTTAYSDTPAEAAQRFVGTNPDSMSNQRVQNNVMSYVMGRFVGAGGLLKKMPVINAAAEVVRGVNRGVSTANTPDYSTVSRPAKGNSAVLDERTTTGLETRQMENVINDTRAPAVKRLTAQVLSLVHGISNPLAYSDRISENQRGDDALQNILNAPRNKPEHSTPASLELERKFTADELDVLYRNTFSGKKRDFTWPGEAEPGLWTREDMPDRYANDSKRWGTTDDLYARSFDKALIPQWFSNPSEARMQRIRPSAFRDPRKAELYAYLYGLGPRPSNP